MAFTDYYSNPSTGSNVNSGSTEAAPVLSLTGGDWVSSTGVYTKTGQVTGVSVGMFGAVRVDGATVAARIGRITAVDANTVTISTTAGSGSLANQTGTASLVVGGPHQGPNAAVSFPFGFLTSAATNAAGDLPFLNLKNNATYIVTATVTHSSAMIMGGGYTSTVRDGGKFILDGGTSGASFNLMSISVDAKLQDFIFQNNGATGSAAGLLTLGGRNTIRRGIVRDVRGTGFDTISGAVKLSKCTAYGCNQSNTASLGGFRTARQNTLYRCIAHSNLGSNASGFVITDTGIAFIHCLSAVNGQHGFNCTGTNSSMFYGCDTYFNGAAGVAAVGLETFINCNFIRNVTYGISGTAWVGLLQSCGFGRGSGAVNALGDIQSVGSYIGTVIAYPSGFTPWVDPANGDFRVSLAEAKGTGDGEYTQVSPYTGTVGYPDIGAAQHLEAAAGGGGRILASSIIQGVG